MASADDIHVRVDGKLRTHLLRQVGAGGRFETPADYVRDLIQRDLESQSELQQWYDLHLKPAFAADQTEYVSVTADEVIRRNRQR